MEANTVYTAKGWTSEGRAIYSKDEKEPFWTLVAKVSTEVPESEMIGVIELLRAAPETARKLAEAEAQARVLAALLAEYFEDFEDTAEARAKNETYAKRCSAALRPMGYYLRNMFDEEAEQEGA